LRYLIMIGSVEVLPRLFERVVVPKTVDLELAHLSTPAPVRAWLAAAPRWLERHADAAPVDGVPLSLGAGERAAIALAQSLPHSLLLIDDRAGVTAARASGLRVTGTVGVLIQAARLRLVDLDEAFSRLRATNFRYRPEFLDALLAREGSRGADG
jgi:predicted nucleic acid-binding protein